MVVPRRAARWLGLGLLGVGIVALLIPACGGSGTRRRSSGDAQARAKLLKAQAKLDAAETALGEGRADDGQALVAEAEKLVDSVTSSRYYPKARRKLGIRIEVLRARADEAIQKASGDLLLAGVGTKANVIGSGPAAGKETAARQEREADKTSSVARKILDDDANLVAERLKRQQSKEEEAEAQEEAPVGDDEPRRQAVRAPDAPENTEAKQSEPVALPLGFDPNNVPATAPVISNVKLERKGKSLVLSFWYANKKATAHMGSVIVDFKVGKRTVATGRHFYSAADFEPNWQDIWESKGRRYAAVEFEVQQNKAYAFIVVAESSRAKDVDRATVKVIVADGRPEAYKDFRDL